MQLVTEDASMSVLFILINLQANELIINVSRDLNLVVSTNFV